MEKRVVWEAILLLRVIDNGNNNTFNVTPVLLAVTPTSGDDVIATSSARSNCSVSLPKRYREWCISYFSAVADPSASAAQDGYSRW